MSRRKLASLGFDEFTDSRLRQRRKRIGTKITAGSDYDDGWIVGLSLWTEHPKSRLNDEPDHDLYINVVPMHLSVDGPSG